MRLNRLTTILTLLVLLLGSASMVSAQAVTGADAKLRKALAALETAGYDVRS